MSREATTTIGLHAEPLAPTAFVDREHTEPWLRTVPVVGTVLHCALTAAPLIALLAGCGDDVSLCTDLDSEPPNCEVCSNRRDDDLDGDVDCDDEECRNAGICRDQDFAATTSTAR